MDVDDFSCLDSTHVNDSQAVSAAPDYSWSDAVDRIPTDSLHCLMNCEIITQTIVIVLVDIRMPMPNAPSSVRECARNIADEIKRCGDDYAKLADALATPVAELARREDLIDIGAPRQGNNVANSWYVYFDGELSILLFEVPVNKMVPPHDHGIWEAFCVYRGRALHKTMQRKDDAAVDGYAELETVSEDTLLPGQLVIIAPPADIHSFEALQPATYGLTIANGPYKPQRLYYQPESNSYEIRQQVNYR